MKLIHLLPSAFIVLLLQSMAFIMVSAADILILENDHQNQDVIYGLDSEDQTLFFGESLTHFLDWDEANSMFSFSDDVSFQDREIQSVRFENLSTAPTCDSSLIGKIYYDTVDSNPYICDGTTWTAFTDSLSEAENIDVINQINTIFEAKKFAKTGKAALTTKVCPYGTDISTNVVSYADGNIVYIQEQGTEEYEVLARLDKGEVHTFLASQGDRVYSLKGDAVVSNAYGTISWPSLAMAGKEFFTYVSRNASTTSPAKAFVITFAAETHLVIEEDGQNYYDEVLPASSVTEIDLNNLSEYYFTADQEISIWYVANNFSIDAKPLPPVTTELLWWNTAYTSSVSPRISALYPNTNITVKYKDGSSESAVASPGNPFQLKFGSTAYGNYGENGAAWVQADGIISGSNTSDYDGSNATAWLSPEIAAQHFVLPNAAQHISFVSFYEGEIEVFDETDTYVTTLTLDRGTSVANDQTYPSSTWYALPGSNGKGYSFQSSVPALSVFDNNESGYAGDETILLGGPLPQNAEHNMILKDITTGNNYQIEIENGSITVEDL